MLAIKDVFYMKTLQIGECTELYVILKNGKFCVTKRVKIYSTGYVLPRFLREISVLKKLNNPPEHLKNHPGRNHIIKILDIYIDHDNGDDFLHFDMEYADGSLIELVNDTNYHSDKILSDISKGLEYIHLMGYNHCDICFNNIVYFKQPDQTLIFVIIDFGNSVHKDRPFTIDTSTDYTMANELIDFDAMIKNIGMQIKYSKLSADQIESIYYSSIQISNGFSHRKSDIWSLGVMAHILFTNHFYENNWDDLDNSVNTNSEIIEKVKKMLTFQSIYFHTDREMMQTTYNTLGTKTESDNIPHSLYHDSITEIIENMSIDNNKNYFINVVDKKTQINIIKMVFSVELKVLEKVLKKMSLRNNMNTLQFMYVMRLIILWLCSHMFINDIWELSDIITSVNKRINNNTKTNILINEMIDEMIDEIFLVLGFEMDA